MKNNLHRIVVKGGVLSLGDFREIITVAESLGLHAISFGSRQDVVLPIQLDIKDLSVFNNLTVVQADQIGSDNIVSSYVSSDIFPNTFWLTGNKYLYVLESFRYQPNLKINITDPKQRLVPLFTGNLNFIASNEEDYWYLYVKLPNWSEAAQYPVLVYSWDVANVAQRIATEIMATGTASHALLGAGVRDSTGNDDNSGFSVGAEIMELTRGGAAEKSGLAVGDVVVKFNGQAITTAGELTAAVRQEPAGAKAVVEVVRNKKTLVVNVVLGDAADLK